jgi:hypothetical protein
LFGCAGGKEDAAKLIAEANERFLAAQEEASRQQEEAARWKRNITSNWTRSYILGVHGCDFLPFRGRRNFNKRFYLYFKKTSIT